MNSYNTTTPRAAAGAAALAATALVIGLSVILPAKISGGASVQAASSVPVMLEPIVVCAERNPELTSAHGKDLPVKAAQQI